MAGWKQPGTFLLEGELELFSKLFKRRKKKSVILQRLKPNKAGIQYKSILAVQTKDEPVEGRGTGDEERKDVSRLQEELNRKDRHTQRPR